MKSSKSSQRAQSARQTNQPQRKQTKTKPTKTTKRSKSTKAKSTQQISSLTTTLNSSIQPLQFGSALTAIGQHSQQPRTRLARTAKRHFGSCGSACGCGPEENAPAQEVSSCGSQKPAAQQCGSDEFNEPQYNEQNIKTIEKMRTQQRDFSLRLYRAILRQHRHLPPDMRMLGDAYVQEEFKLHKNAKPEHLQPFFEQWIDYLGHLRDAFDQPEQLGKNIPIETIDQLDDEQKEKLFKMHDETYRLFGGELNETDVGMTYDEIPADLKQSGIFGQAANEAAGFVPPTEMAPKIKTTTTTTAAV